MATSCDGGLGYRAVRASENVGGRTRKGHGAEEKRYIGELVPALHVGIRERGGEGAGRFGIIREC